MLDSGQVWLRLDVVQLIQRAGDCRERCAAFVQPRRVGHEFAERGHQIGYQGNETELADNHRRLGDDQVAAIAQELAQFCSHSIGWLGVTQLA